MHKRVVLTILILIIFIWLTIIFMLSNMSSTSSNNSSTSIISNIIKSSINFTNKYDITNINPSDETINIAAKLINAPLRKVVHMLEYLILFILLMFTISDYFDFKKYLIPLLLSIILVISFASIDEYHQSLVGRDGHLIDVLIDTEGAFIGSIIYSSYYFVYLKGRKSV